MNHYRYSAAVRLAIFLTCLAPLPSRVSAQIFSASNPYDASLSRGTTQMWTGLAPFSSLPALIPPPAYAGPVSADILRHPLSAKAHRMILKALDFSVAGQHPKAIEQLRETLLKQPSSAPYVHGGLGIEYAHLGQLSAAIAELEHATRELPHIAETHSLLAQVLSAAGDYDRAEREARRALELNPRVPDAEEVLLSLLRRKDIKAVSPSSPAPGD